MAVNLSPVGGVAAQFFTNTGAVLTGGKLYTYLAGTTTPATTYTSSTGSTPWSNPIVLDAAGRVSGSGEIWLTDGIIYKFVLKDTNDVLIATYDNITGINSNSVAYTNQQQIITATAGQTVFNLSISYQLGTNSLSVFVDGVNQYGPGAQYAYTETDSDTVTFVSGLHVGAQVKFTTTQQQGAGAVDASQVSYIPPFTGSVATNVEDKLAQTISVMDFGAVGDGVTNDTAAIQAANLAAAGGTLYFPAGVYLSDGTEVLSNTTYVGDGIGATTIKLRVNTGHAFSNWKSGSPTNSLTNITIKNMTLDGNYNALTDPLNDNLSIGIYILYSENIRVQNVHMKNYWFGGVNVFGCRQFWIQDNIVTNCGDKNTYLGYYDGIQFDGGGFVAAYAQGRNGVIERNYVKDCGGGLRSNGAATVATTSKNYVVSDNTILDCKVTGIWFFDSWGEIVISNNKINNVGSYGILISCTNTVSSQPYYAPRTIKIVNNTVDVFNTNNVTGTAGITASAIYDISVRGNSVYNVGANSDGIQVLSAYDKSSVVTDNRYFKVCDNTIISSVTNARWGIQINSSYGLVSNNTIEQQFSNGGGVQVIGIDNKIRSNFMPNVSVGIVNSGTNTKFSSNLGYTTYNSAIQAAANNGDVISHGLAGAPNSVVASQCSSSQDVIVGVTAVTSSTFTVSIIKRSDGTAGPATNVAWQAQMTGNE